MQLLRRYGEAFVLNPGSVGLPFERKRLSEDVYNPPWAEYALVGWESASLSIQLKRVPLDITAVTRAALESGMPHAEVWVKDWRRE